MSEYAAPSNIAWSGKGYGVAEFGSDNQMIVIFYSRPVENPAKSLEAGRKICTDQDYVKMYHPGEGNTNQIDRPVKQEDTRRFPRQWEQYLHNRTQAPEGTPIDLLYPNNPSTAENLRGMGVFTVEQAANLSAHAQDRVGMGSQDIVNKAKAFLENAAKGINFHKHEDMIKKLQQENKLKDTQVLKLQQQVDILMQKLTSPADQSLSPPWSATDEQTQRINANHVTNQIKPKPATKVKSTKPVSLDSYGEESDE